MGERDEELCDHGTVSIDMGALAREQRMANLIEVAKMSGMDLEMRGRPELLIAKYGAFEAVLKEIERGEKVAGIRAALRDARPGYSDAEIEAEIQARFPQFLA